MGALGWGHLENVFRALKSPLSSCLTSRMPRSGVPRSGFLHLQTTKNNTMLYRSLSLAFVLSCAHLHAFTVPVVNPSFEDNVIAAPQGSSGLTGWEFTLGGSFRSTAAFGLVPTDGLNVAFSNSGAIAQTLVSTLTANTTYTLLVDVGDRSDLPFPGYQVRLLAGAALLAQDNNSLAPSSGFLTSNLSYTSTASDPSIGSPLRIELVNLGGVQVLWDHVRLDATAIPEPASAMLVGLVAMVFSVSSRRRKMI